MSSDNIQSFQIVYTELDSKIPQVSVQSGHTKEEAEKNFEKQQLDKHIVRDHKKELYLVKAEIV